MLSLSSINHILLHSLSCVVYAVPGSFQPRLSNGLAIRPPMGWNSYNHYSCSPNESIIHSNAQAVKDLGLQAIGYHYITVDCGWTLPDRAANGTLTPNPTRFPSGYPALGQFIHSLGLGFGVYSDAGVQMCMTGDPAQVGGLFHEQQDAETFASWGADLLKYDDCYSEASTGYPNVDYTPIVSPSGRYANMTKALASLSRPVLFQICDWGVDFPSAWAPALGNSWRISNDIIPSYKTIPRILNQAAPQTSFAGPGQWLDLDMLEVGNNVFTIPEEQTHFSLWAIIKSPLVIGAALKDTVTSINSASLAILMNVDVIGYNQDIMGVAASFKRRWTQEGYEVWSGPLSDGRTVAALINNQNVARSLTLDFPVVGIQRAGTVKDIWNMASANNVLTSYTATVPAHGTILLELGATTIAGTYSATDAVKTGQLTTFSKVYGSTTSSSYIGSITLSTTSTSTTSIIVNSKTYILPANTATLNVTISLPAANNNTITITSPLALTSLIITQPAAVLYPSTSFSIAGAATKTACEPSLCSPVGTKIGYLGPSGSASLTVTSPSGATPGSKYVDVYFINNDIAFESSWSEGTNTRNLTISVNGETTRIETPLSGKSSELFSPGLGWQDTGVFGTTTAGWITGNNNIVVSNAAGGLVDDGADFVGISVRW